ncbi:MAG TPA: EAL domain-containing protein [Steroidobacteraceae bacterium]|jgi:PAS domain S-box-containing protein/diguanylate cyclase (GGDEF)-like protein|nr:EAL domain-containing protein [Steroidobacteraceae bacterium]
MKPPIRLVMVEDTPADAELILRGLKRAQLECEAHRVDTEPDFIRALQQRRPQLILSDFSMPQFDGLRALQIAVERVPDVPFIFVSGTIGEERAIDALRRGATDYVLKGNLARLAAAVERALAEASLKRSQREAEQQLRDNEQRLRDTVETSQDWIWEVDQAGRFRFCSKAVIHMLGYDPAALIDQDYRNFLMPSSADGAAALLPVGQDPLTGAVACWRAADGQARWLERNAVAILDDRGQLLGYRGTDRDITARREQEARLRRLTRTYRMLSSTGSAILRLHERGELLQEICRIAVQQGGYERVVIGLREGADPRLRREVWAGEGSMALRTIEQLLLQQCESAAASGLAAGASSAESALVENELSGAPLEHGAHRAPGALSHQARAQLLAHGYRAIAALPLKVDGTTVGTLLLLSRQAGVFDAAERQVLEELTANLGFALQYLQKDEAVQFLSYYDGLTGLAKRVLFCQRLDRQLGDVGRPARTVVVFDVQQLSAINDSYGRYVGDALIAEIAERLKQSHDGESIAYFGAGTFAIHCDSAAASVEQGRLLPLAVAQLFAEPFGIDAQELRPGVRAGMAQHPQDAMTADQLVQHAEAALKAAREDNERYLPYASIRQRPDSRKLALEGRLAGALDRNELLLHYQPKVDLQSGRVVGLEALLRWQDAHDGMVSPAVFIPLMERSGAIAEVGEWVLQQAIRDAATWQQRGAAAVRIAVNVSPLQLRRRDFVERVLASVRPASAQRPLVDVEITESMLMQDLELSIRKLQELCVAGIGVAIDDFGTGYSSLRMLARLPVDTLKIDRYFIQGMSESANGGLLVSTVVSLAEAFGMTVVAEGVETADQAQALRRMRCAQAQGYLFCRPTPAALVPEAIARLNDAGTCV